MVAKAIVEEFKTKLRGDLLRPGDAGYDEARTVWNGMIDRHPALIVRCAGTDDVIAAVNFARDHDLLVAVRGGGHNVAGSAVCDGGIMIDLSQMNTIQVDATQRTARAGGGATLGDVDRATQQFGLATALGVVSKTGIAGLTLNGGVGHLRRKYGLGCDNLKSVEIVTADGRLLTASEDQNADLFWAVRGGGGNFGVVTSFEYRLHEVGPQVFGLFVWHHGDKAEEALRRFREYTKSASHDASVLPFYAFVPKIEEFPEAAWGQPALVFLGCHIGDEATASEELRPLREMAEPIADLSSPVPYTELQTMLDGDYPDGWRYYWKAVFLDDLNDEVIDFMVRRGAESPSKLSTVDLWHLGGAISDISQDATAFWHRDKPYLVTFEANWTDPVADDENMAWVRDCIVQVREMPAVSGGYGNFPGFNEDPARTVFGGNYDRLVEVKNKYDPANLFRVNQNIKPAV